MSGWLARPLVGKRFAQRQLSERPAHHVRIVDVARSRLRAFLAGTTRGGRRGAEPPKHNRPEPTVLADWPWEYTGIMQDDSASPSASQSAGTQPESMPVQNQSRAGISTEVPIAPEPAQSPEVSSTEPVSVSTSPQSEPSANTPSAQDVPPITEPIKQENQTVQANTEAQNVNEAEANPPQNPPSPEAISDQQVEIPIPPFHYPFYGSYPISFDFGAVSTDENIQKKYQEWGILGHNGVDFALREGTEVLSCDEGVVIQVGDNGDFGITVTIKHSWGTSIYCHLQSFGVLVNDHVSKAQVVGLSDHTGFVTGPHLHFGIQPNDVNINNGYLGYINPNPYLSETSEKPQSPPQPEPVIQSQPVNPPAQPDVQSPQPPQQPQSSDDEIEKQATAMFDARLKENSIKGNQAKKEKRDEALQKIFSFAQEKRKSPMNKFVIYFTFPKVARQIIYPIL